MAAGKWKRGEGEEEEEEERAKFCNYMQTHCSCSPMLVQPLYDSPNTLSLSLSHGIRDNRTPCVSSSLDEQRSYTHSHLLLLLSTGYAHAMSLSLSLTLILLSFLSSLIHDIASSVREREERPGNDMRSDMYHIEREREERDGTYADAI